ncbi:hypothetical protein ACIA5H_30075 [Nocardia sp. NPDC051900]|uniref:hypothetical protein n=1 Tax=Nocardia sp. NPDC051900 TaxID=3364326 RepID=UPI0037A974B2
MADIRMNDTDDSTGQIYTYHEGVIMPKPTHEGKAGETVFDGTTTWLCLGGNKWVDKLGRESDPLNRRKDEDTGGEF